MPTRKEELCNLMLVLRRKMMESAKNNSLKEEVTFSQFEVLWFIGFHGKRSMEAIADFLKIAPPSATSMIAKMEKRKLVRRSRDPDDRRVVHVSLAPRIKKELTSMRTQKEKVFGQLVGKLSAGDREQLARIIRKLTND